MIRPLIIVCALSTLLLGSLIVFRIATKKTQSQHQVEVLGKIVDSFTLVKTHPLNLEGFSRAVHAHAGTNLNTLSENEREKLFACINRFYDCYSSGKYDDYKTFRLNTPFTIREEISSFFKKIAASKGIDLKSDGDILRFGWNYENGTNKIGEVSEDSMVLSVMTRNDAGIQLHLPSVATNWPEFAVASCWDAGIVYKPTPDDILKNEGSLLFFKLQFFARFYPNVDSPATPLVFVGYWDPTQNNWMPSALCHMLQVGGYNTMF